MATTPKFNVPVPGNGFASCLVEVDVSSFNTVRPMSLRQAMKLFWNVNKINATGSATSGFLASGFQVGVKVDDTTRLTNVFKDPDPAEPRVRVCGSASASDEEFEQPDGPGGNYALVNVACDVEIVRLLDGSTLIGYGVTQNQIFVESYGNAADLSESVNFVGLVSYGDFNTPGWSSEFLPANTIPPANIDETVASVTINDIPFTKLTASGLVGSGGNDPDVNIVSAVAALDDFDIYSY